MSYRVGVDIGGTFTDFFVFDETTLETQALKVPSRPDRPGAEVLEGIRQLEARFGYCSRRDRPFQSRHHRGREYRDPAQGHQALPLHDRGVRRRAGGGQAENAGCLQPAFETPRPAHSQGACLSGRRTSGKRWQRTSSGRQGQRRGRRRKGARGARRRNRRVAPERLPQSRPRTRGGRPGAGDGTGASCVLLHRRLVDHSRVRAHDHRGHPRLRATARQPLSRLDAGRASRGRRAGRAACHEVERRGDERRDGQDRLRPDDHVGHRLRRDRREPCRRSLRAPRRHQL